MKVSEILTELRANSSVFDSILKDESIKMGFECEMVLNGHEFIERNFIDPNELTWEEVKEYLDINWRNKNRLDQNYDEWIEEGMHTEWNNVSNQYTEEWITKKGIADLSNNDERQDIIDEYRDDASDDWTRTNELQFRYRYTIDDYIDEVSGNKQNFIIQNNFEPRYGWNNDGMIYTDFEEEEEEESAHKNAAISIEYNLGCSVETHSDHNFSTKDPSMWYVEPDSSIDSVGNGVGAEVVSSVYSVGRGIERLKQMFVWIDDNARTNSTTGLHVSLSIKGKNAEDFDFLKMMILFDENYTAKLFDRLFNVYSLPMRDRIINMIGEATVDDMFDTNDMKTLLKRLRYIGQALESTFQKYSSIRSRQNGVFEFRGMGGNDYQREYDTVRKEIVQMAYILKAGSDDKLFAKEYIRKLYLMLDQGKYNNAKLGSGKTRVAAIPKGLGAFADLFKSKIDSPDLRNVTPLEYLDVILDHYNSVSKDVVLSTRQKMQLKLFVNKHYTLETAQTVFEQEDYNFLAHLMKWPLAISKIDGQHTLPFAHSGGRENYQPLYATAPNELRQEPMPFAGDLQSERERRSLNRLMSQRPFQPGQPNLPGT